MARWLNSCCKQRCEPEYRGPNATKPTSTREKSTPQGALKNQLPLARSAHVLQQPEQLLARWSSMLSKHRQIALPTRGRRFQIGETSILRLQISIRAKNPTKGVPQLPSFRYDRCSRSGAHPTIDITGALPMCPSLLLLLRYESPSKQQYIRPYSR